MSFAAPQWLWALLLVPALLLFSWRRGRGGVENGGIAPARARWVQVDARGARPVPAGRPAGRHGVGAALACALGIVALAQPQWGTRDEVQFDQAREVLIALDLSRSMLAEDVPPSRLGRARLLVESTLDELEGERVGLLLFAGTAFLQSPLSADHEVLREILPVLEPGYLPQGGTDFGAMIEAALEAFSQTGAADRYLVVLSDGESEAFDASAVSSLTEADVRVIALGIGTEAGALIPDGAGGIVKDDRGAAVLSRLERGALERLANETSGVYVDAASWLDLADLVERTVSMGRSGEFVERREEFAVHRFQWWLGPAVLLLLVSHLFEFPTSPRTQVLRNKRTSGPTEDAIGAAQQASIALGLLVAYSCFIGIALGLSFATPRAFAAEPPPQPPNPIVETVARLAETPAPTSADYAELASRTLEVGQAQQGAGEPMAEGVVLDGLVSIEVGKRLDASAADWAALRAGLEALLETPPPSPSSGDSGQGESGESKEDQAGGSESQTSSGERQESGEGDPSEASGQESGDNDASEGEGGAADPEADGSSPADAEPRGDDDAGAGGEKPQGDPQALDNASAGFGGLGEEDEGGDDEPPDAEVEETGVGASEVGGEAERETHEGARPSRLVGGAPSANEELIQQRPELSSAIGRMEHVRESDAPAVLFDRMNVAEGRVDEGGGSTW